MRKVLTLVLLFAMSAAAFADVFEGQAAYVGGTISGLAEGTVGKLDTTQATNLVFEHAGGKVVIPYAKIESWDYTHVVAHHLGVIPTVAIVMVKFRQRRHYFHIQYKDDAGVTQAVVIEVPKQMPKAFTAVLQARVKSCSVSYNGDRCEVPRPPVIRSTPNHAASQQTVTNPVTASAQK